MCFLYLERKSFSEKAVQPSLGHVMIGLYLVTDQKLTS